LLRIGFSRQKRCTRGLLAESLSRRYFDLGIFTICRTMRAQNAHNIQRHR